MYGATRTVWMQDRRRPTSFVRVSLDPPAATSTRPTLSPATKRDLCTYTLVFTGSVICSRTVKTGATRCVLGVQARRRILWKNLGIGPPLYTDTLLQRTRPTKQSDKGCEAHQRLAKSPFAVDGHQKPSSRLCVCVGANRKKGHWWN